MQATTIMAWWWQPRHDGHLTVPTPNVQQSPCHQPPPQYDDDNLDMTTTTATPPFSLPAVPMPTTTTTVWRQWRWPQHDNYDSTPPFLLSTCNSAHSNPYHYSAMTGSALPSLSQHQRPRNDHNDGYSTIPLQTCSSTHTNGHHSTMTRNQGGSPHCLHHQGERCYADGLLYNTVTSTSIVLCSSYIVIDNLIYSYVQAQTKADPSLCGYTDWDAMIKLHCQ